MKKIVRNRIKCKKCGEIIESTKAGMISSSASVERLL